jgi:hypothetical protein
VSDNEVWLLYLAPDGEGTVRNSSE